MKRINFLTLGVQDLEKSKSFLRDLFSWEPLPQEAAGVAFYDMGGWVLSLFGWNDLAQDATVSPASTGFRGISIASNVAEKADVAVVLEKAKSLGAEIIKPAHDVFRGGHSGYFRDLDGHLWEVAWNPLMPLNADGTVNLKTAGGAPNT